MPQQKSQAGFEYFLDKLEQEKAKVRNRVSLNVLKLLARDPNGSESLSELVSQIFSHKPAENELVEFTTVLRNMVDEKLVAMQLPDGATRSDYQKLIFSITESGKKYLEVSDDTQLQL